MANVYQYLLARGVSSADKAWTSERVPRFIERMPSSGVTRIDVGLEGVVKSFMMMGKDLKVEN